MNKTNIFIPEKCKVGFNTRKDTFTGKLGYVIYYKDKEWKQEKSWESWRQVDETEITEELKQKCLNEYNATYCRWGNQPIDSYDNISPHYKLKVSNESVSPIEFDNTPMEGFVLNKKVGGHSSGWNHRQAKARVYHPLGFEFEISFENVLYLLEHTNFIVGKGIEGKCILGWEGKNIVLIPENSSDYQEMMKFTSNQSKKSIKLKDLKVGHKYLTKQNEEWIYLGQYNEYGYCNLGNDEKYTTLQFVPKVRNKVHLFYDVNRKYGHYIEKTTCTTIIQELEEVDITSYLEEVSKMSKYVGVVELIPYEVDKSEYTNYYPNRYYYKKQNRYIRIDNVHQSTRYGKPNDDNCLHQSQFDNLDKLYKFKIKLQNGNII